MTDDKDKEIIPREDAQPFSCTVIDLADMRVRFGLPKIRNRCEHKNLVYNIGERRVWCKECETEVGNFDAFMTLVRNFAKMVKEANRKTAELNEALKSAARLRATKALDKEWGRKRMVPCCPHCKKGLMPEDFADGVTHRVSKEYELARRKKEN